MKYLLDTDVVSQYAKNRPDPRVDAWIERTDDRDLYLSAFTLAELSSGIHSLAPGKKRSRLEGWLEDDLYMQFFNRIIFFDMDIVARYGSLMAKARQGGFSPGAMDTLIVASARQRHDHCDTEPEGFCEVGCGAGGVLERAVFFRDENSHN